MSQEYSQMDEAVMDSVMGHAIVQWQVGQAGMQLMLDDGRVLIIVGGVGVLTAERATVH